MTRDDPTRVDYWFAHKLGDRFLFLGYTDAAIRRERIREAILSRTLGDKRLGTNRDGVDETFRQAFERIYQHDLKTGDPIHA